MGPNNEFTFVNIQKDRQNLWSKWHRV